MTNAVRHGLGAVILNYRCAPATAQSVNALLQGSVLPRAIVVVDNSADEEQARLLAVEINRAIDDMGATCDAPPKVTILVSPTNGGYSAGNNIGLRFLRSLKCTEALVCNPDCQVGVTCVDSLVETLTMTSDVAVASPILYRHNGTVDCAGGGAWDGRLGRTRLIFEGEDSPSRAMIVPSMFSGACFMVDLGVLERIGWLDERYFLYFEELDLTRRLSEIGQKTAVSRDAVGIHGRGLTTSASQPSGFRRSESSTYHSMKSAMIFGFKWREKWLPIWVFGRLVLLSRIACKSPSVGFAGLRGLASGLAVGVRQVRRPFNSGPLNDSELAAGFGVVETVLCD